MTADELFEQGVELYENEKLEEAEKSFTDALQLSPRSEEIMYNLALVYFEQKKFDLCYNLIDHIHEIDCTEIYEALEAEDYQPKFEIPDDIPEQCDMCTHFIPGSLIRENGGFCSFYKMYVDTTSHCHAYRLLDEGKVTQDEIDSHKKDALQEKLNWLEQELNDLRLPKEVTCANCGAELELNETERQTRQFNCAKCNHINDVAQKAEALKDQQRNILDIDLFKVLVTPQDYLPEFVIAAKKEINRRFVNVRDKEEVIALLKKL